MSNETVVQVKLTMEEIGTRVGSSEFEDKVAAAAFPKVVIADGESLRLKDIDVTEEGVIAHVVRYVPEEKPIVEIPEPQPEEKPEESEDRTGLLAESKAKKGPLEEQVWEIGVTEMCAIMDMLAMAETFMAPRPKGVGPTPLLHAVHRLRSFFYACVAVPKEGSERQTPDGKTIVSLEVVPEFWQHYRVWVEEAKEEFAEFAKQMAGRNVVAARIVPGQGFNPKGNG